MSKRPAEEPARISLWNCRRCKIEFCNASLTQAHFSAACADIWCSACQRSFVDVTALRQHAQEKHRELSLRTAPAPGPVKMITCLGCGLKVGPGEMIPHWAESGCHVKCKACGIWHYRKHIADHLARSPTCKAAHPAAEPLASCGDKRENVPPITKRAPASPVASSPMKSKATIKPIPAFCLHCSKPFLSAASLISHFENGHCKSKVQMRDVNYTFATFEGSESFLLSDNRKTLGSLLNYEFVADRKPAPFRCPKVGCTGGFKSLSSLMTHAYSGACAGTFKRTIEQAVVHLRTNMYPNSIKRRIENIKAAGPGTLFIRPPPYLVAQEFADSPDFWRPAVADLFDRFAAILEDVFYRPADPNRASALSFGNVAKTERCITDFGNALMKLQNGCVQLNSKKGPGQGLTSAQILVCSKTRRETRTLDHFLNEVEAVWLLLDDELKANRVTQRAL
ncbi:hypothetical protein DRE_05365 [Drechslerella stenobrocha 248]|uniref:C2H2-type domain-containing protein n=1 Tax=Drechslerella stenobrocha 248 TaxID=1043628 RepID=W7HZ89_9PEZI|nr:hypothetical protein DRE_05365 [Drechslerella stenobrocha 248]